jgi:MFS family permease
MPARIISFNPRHPIKNLFKLTLRFCSYDRICVWTAEGACRLQTRKKQSPMVVNAPAETSTTYRPWSVALIFAAPALGGFLFGFDIAATSFVVVALPSINSFVQGLIVSAASLGAFMACFWIFRDADRIGRRAELRYGACFYIVGVIGESLAGLGLAETSSARNEICLTTLTLSRLLYGFGIAFSMHGGPTYIAEMSPTELRGFLVSMKEASIVFGILIGYCAGFTFTKSPTAVALTHAVAFIPAIAMLTLTFVIPQSCRWLMMVGRNAESLDSMGYVFRGDRVMDEYGAMTRQMGGAAPPEEPEEVSEEAFGHIPEASGHIPDESEETNCQEESLLSPRLRAPLVTGIGLVVLQQVTGQPSILSYATPIFQKIGLSDSASILVAAFKLVATIFAASTVEQFGRRTLLFGGNTLMLIALLLLAAPIGASTVASSWIILSAMFLYIGGYQVSFGPITWLMISEVFPLAIRGRAVAVSVQMNFLLNAIVQLIIPVLENLIGLRSMFGMFAVLTLGRYVLLQGRSTSDCFILTQRDQISIFFVKSYVPETRGLSLEEIEQQYRSRSRNYSQLPTGT